MEKNNFLKALELGVDINHYLLMVYINNKDTAFLWDNPKIRAWRSALDRKGFIVETNGEYYLTDKGIEILKSFTEEKIEAVVVVDSNPIEVAAENILKEVKQVLKDRIGMERMINPSGKPYLCSKRDLTKRLLDFMQKFKFSDLDKIKQAILDYTHDILDTKLKSPRTLLFFIYKNDVKQGLISDMEGYIETAGEREKRKSKKDVFG